MKKRLMATLALLTLVISGARAEKVSRRAPLMGTLFQITTYTDGPQTENARRAMDAAIAKAREIDQIASDYLPDSEINRLCRAPHGQARKISPVLLDLLRRALATAEKTDGIYDPTLGPLTRLWRHSRESKTLPGRATLAAARARCGYRHLALDPEKSTVTLGIPDMQIDLGGIAKGYTADAMLAILKEKGFPRSMIAAGGDIRLGSAPPDRQGWKVGLRTNRKKIDKVITLTNCAVSTSGDLHQWVEIDGTRYAHIIDPATGLGLTSGAAASVIAPEATTSDPLATAACLLPDPTAFFKNQKNTSLRLLREGHPPLLSGRFTKK